MSKKRTIERGYFHISNGGLSLRVVEKTDQREHKEYAPYPKNGETKEESDKRLASPLKIETRHNRRWYLEVSLSNFGGTTSFRFPLFPLMVRYMIDMLRRVLGRMEAPSILEPTDGIEYPFRDIRKVSITHQDGRGIEYDWPTTVDLYQEQMEASSDEDDNE